MRRRVCGAAFGTALMLALAVSATASAHVVKQFGSYSVAMGWLHEPTYVGVENSVQVIVKDGSGNPVNDLQPGDLQVVVSTAGQQTAALPLQIFSFAIAPYEDWHRLAWAGALVLVTVMFSLSITARYFGRSRH